jgi:hypothetical protein
MVTLTNRQKACCLKIRKHRDLPHKAIRYFAALIGSGAKPEDTPLQVKHIWKQIKASTVGDDLITFEGCTRTYLCPDYWDRVCKTFPALNLATEIRFTQTFG